MTAIFYMGEKTVTLNEFFEQNPKAALAFSGGVDSAYLLSAAITCGCDICAYYVKSEFQPQFELEDAKKLAEQLGARLKVIELSVLSEENICANRPDRCYHCKKRILSAAAAAARSDGYSLLLDGTNASDEAEDRPGMKAICELGVRSPLRECGITKAELRERSWKAGLFTWDKPAYACLATRIPQGTEITAAALETTERAEAVLTEMGFRDFRIRMAGTAARIQLPASQLELLLARREEVLAKLKPYYESVTLDLEVRK